MKSNFLKKINRRRLICSSVFSFIMSIFIVIGKQLNDTGKIKYDFLLYLNLVVVFAAVNLVTYFFIDKVILKKTKNFKIKFWHIFVPLFVMSLFYLWACYPGNYNYDVMVQYNAYKLGEYTTHFPIVYCFILGNFLDFVMWIFNDANFAVFLFNLLQITLVNLTVAYAVYFFSKKLENKWYKILTTAFFVTNPLYMNMIMSTCQDISFAIFFALILIEVVKMIEDKEYLSNKSNWIKIIVLVFLFCIFRNNGFFAIIPSVILTLFFIGGGAKVKLKFAALFAIPLAIFQVYNIGFVNNVVTEKESMFKESLNIPIAQISRAFYYNHDETWTDEINKFFKEDCKWEKYKKYPAISDHIKNCMNTGYMNEHFMDFIKLYIGIGSNAPRRYLEAPMLFWLNAYYPFVTYPSKEDENITHWVFDAHSVHTIQGHEQVKVLLDVERKPNLPAVERFFTRFFHYGQQWSHVLILHLLWGGSFTTILLIFAVVYNIYKKRYKYLVPLCFVFGLLITVLLAPIVYYRYLIPIVIAIPTMLYTIFAPYKTGKTLKKKNVQKK